LIVGASVGEENVLVYEFNGGAWDLVEELPSNHSSPRVATDGSTIVIGSPYYASLGGRALVYYSPGAPVVLVDAPAANPTEGGTGTESVTAIDPVDGGAELPASETNIETERETGISDGPSENLSIPIETKSHNGTTQSSTPVPSSSVSTAFGSLYSTVFLTMTIVHFAVQYFLIVAHS